MADFDWSGKYCGWLKDNISIEKVSDGWTEIATPFLDSINDGIVVYAKKSGNKIILSDDGHVLNSILDAKLCAFAEDKKYKSFLGLLKSLDVELKGGELIKTTTVANYALNLNLFVHTLIVISHLPYISAQCTDDTKTHNDEEQDKCRKRLSPYERTKAAVYATGNRWAIENFNATH